jgi:hypothetical protein
MVHRIFVLLLVVGAAARAQSAFGSQGQIVPFGTVAYTHASGFVGGDANQILIQPGAMWFPANNVAVGGQVIYGFVDAGTSFHELGFEPLVGFAVPFGNQLAFFPRVGMQFEWLLPSGGNSANRVALDGFAPLLFIPAPHVYIGFGPQLNVEVASSAASKVTSFGLASQIGGYF